MRRLAPPAPRRTRPCRPPRLSGTARLQRTPAKSPRPGKSSRTRVPKPPRRCRPSAPRPSPRLPVSPSLCLLEAVQDAHLKQFDAAADAELAELLPEIACEIDNVRAEKEDAAKMASSFKRRASGGKGRAGKRPQKDAAAAAAPECGICIDRFPNTAFMSGNKSNRKTCGHMACGPCAEKLKECHVCRTKITAKSTLFF